MRNIVEMSVLSIKLYEQQRQYFLLFLLQNANGRKQGIGYAESVYMSELRMDACGIQKKTGGML